MRELLEKWAALEPERCHEVEYGDGTAIAVVVEGETLYADSPGRVKFDQAMNRAVILAATIEAIEAHEGRFTLKRDIGDGHYFAAVRFPSQKTPRNAKSYQPAAALLLAYLAAIEAEGAS